jgi:NAD(P)-dependent dehydrogenase (short-subunit alcohol dehydrogenase family)
MGGVFGATSTTDEVLAGVNLRGKRILVTGVSAGLGVETARALTAHGAHVVGAARDLVKSKAATEQVRKDADANRGGFEVVELDLANLKSVRACADGLLARREPFDVIIANAGVMATPFGHTPDGFETQFGHQSPRPLRSGQPDCASAPYRWAADQSVFGRSPLFQCRPGRSQF